MYAIACASGFEIVYRAIEREHSPIVWTVITTIVLAVLFWLPASLMTDIRRERRLREAIEQHPVLAFIFILLNAFLMSKGLAMPEDSKMTKCGLRLLSMLQGKDESQAMLGDIEECYFIQLDTIGFTAAQKWRRDEIWKSLQPLLKQRVCSTLRGVVKWILPLILPTIADHFLKRIGF